MAPAQKSRRIAKPAAKAKKRETSKWRQVPLATVKKALSDAKDEKDLRKRVKALAGAAQRKLAQYPRHDGTPEPKPTPARPPPPRAGPKRPLSEVPREDLVRAIAEQATPSAIAFVLHVDLLELNATLADDEDLKKALRQARVAARAVADTRLALAVPFAASELHGLAEASTPADSVRQGACATILQMDKEARKADIAAAPPKKFAWDGPGEPKVLVVRTKQEVEALLYGDEDERDGE